MAFNITLTPGLKTGLDSLNTISRQIDQTNERLATGKKVNSPLDNALNFFLADSFSRRASGLSAIQDGIGLGINVISQANKAYDSIKTSLAQIEGTIRGALNTAGTQGRAVSTFQFRDPVTGAASASQLLAEAAAGTSGNRLQVGDTIQVNLVTISSTGFTATVGNANLGAIAAGTTVQNLLDNINVTATSTLNVAGQAARVTAYLNDAGNIVVENNIQGNDASGNTYALQFVVNTGAGTGAALNNTLTAFSFTGAVGANPTVSASSTATQTVTILGGNTNQATRASAAESFREVLNQIRNSALDAGFNGTNLLQGDNLRVGFNEDGTTSLTQQGRRIDSAALGFITDVVAAQVGDAARNFQSDRELNNALTKVRAAQSTVTGYQTSLTTNLNILTNRQDYTEFLVKNLNDSSDLLTVADINEEGANLTALQTRQQLAVTALGLASQSDQAILRLF